MILINLLPKPKKEPETAVSAKRSLRMVWLGGFVIFLAASVYNVYLFGTLRLEHHQLENKWQALAPRFEEALQLEQAIGPGIKSKIDFFNSAVDPAPEAARILNLAGDLIPAGIILTEASLKRKGQEFSIALNGTAQAGQSESALIEIQKYAESLKNALEEALEKAEIGVPPDSKPSLEMQVTTGRRAASIASLPSALGDEPPAEPKGRVTEFQALLQTDGFKEK